MPGAEPWSHTAAATADGPAPGALVIHGFTGNPASMRTLAEAFAAAGFNVEMPRLPGHGTTVEDMRTTGWADWTGEVEAAYQRVSARSGKVVVAGLSMGGSLTLWTASQHPEVAGIVCINPATEPAPKELIDMFAGMVADGTEVMPGIGSDIADPDSKEIAYDGVPLRALLSFMQDGLTPLAPKYGDMRVPLLLLTSRQDHVVEPKQSESLAAQYGGDVDHRWLERSYHVATQDYDREYIEAEATAFAKRVTGS